MRDVSRYFIHVVEIIRGPTGAAGTGTDQYGEALADATPEVIVVNARVEFDNSLVIDDTGKECVCAGSVFLAWTYPDASGNEVDLDLGPEDRIRFEGRTYTIARRNRQEGWTDDPGRHWEAYIR